MKTIDAIGIASGILAVVVFSVLTAIAILRDPEFVWFHSFLSDLGIGPGSAAFNSGLIICCSLGIVFAIFLIRPGLSPSISRELGVAFVVVMCVFGILAGVYTEDYYPQHYYASMGTFFSMVVALGFLTYSLTIDDPLGEWFTEFSKATVAAGILLLVIGNNPLGEYLTIVLILVWLLVFTYLRARQLLMPEGMKGTRRSDSE